MLDCGSHPDLYSQRKTLCTYTYTREETSHLSLQAQTATGATMAATYLDGGPLHHAFWRSLRCLLVATGCIERATSICCQANSMACESFRRTTSEQAFLFDRPC